jgi:hypothetical protein
VTNGTAEAQGQMKVKGSSCSFSTNIPQYACFPHLWEPEMSTDPSQKSIEKRILTEKSSFPKSNYKVIAGPYGCECVMFSTADLRRLLFP